MSNHKLGDLVFLQFYGNEKVVGHISNISGEYYTIEHTREDGVTRSFGARTEDVERLKNKLNQHME